MQYSSQISHSLQYIAIFPLFQSIRQYQRFRYITETRLKQDNDTCPNISIFRAILQYSLQQCAIFHCLAFDIAILKVISHSAFDIARSTTLVVQYSAHLLWSCHVCSIALTLWYRTRISHCHKRYRNISPVASLLRYFSCSFAIAIFLL